jgi:hypothetical protein
LVLFKLVGVGKEAINKARGGEWSLNSRKANDTDLDLSEFRVNVRIPILDWELVDFGFLLFGDWQLFF